jgi:arylsulfatase
VRTNDTRVRDAVELKRRASSVPFGERDIMENLFLNVKNKSKSITAEIEVPSGRANGVILVQGGRFNGWALYVKDDRPTRRDRSTICQIAALKESSAAR